MSQTWWVWTKGDRKPHVIQGVDKLSLFPGQTAAHEKDDDLVLYDDVDNEIARFKAEYWYAAYVK